MNGLSVEFQVAVTPLTLAIDRQRLLEASRHVPIFHMEDVYLTGMLSDSIGVRPQYHPGFTGTNQIQIH